MNLCCGEPLLKESLLGKPLLRGTFTWATFTGRTLTGGTLTLETFTSAFLFDGTLWGTGAREPAGGTGGTGQRLGEPGKPWGNLCESFP